MCFGRNKERVATNSDYICSRVYNNSLEESIGGGLGSVSMCQVSPIQMYQHAIHTVDGQILHQFGWSKATSYFLGGGPLFFQNKTPNIKLNRIVPSKNGSRCFRP